MGRRCFLDEDGQYNVLAPDSRLIARFIRRDEAEAYGGPVLNQPNPQDYSGGSDERVVVCSLPMVEPKDIMFEIEDGKGTRIYKPAQPKPQAVSDEELERLALKSWHDLSDMQKEKAPTLLPKFLWGLAFEAGYRMAKAKQAWPTQKDFDEFYRDHYDRVGEAPSAVACWNWFKRLGA